MNEHTDTSLNNATEIANKKKAPKAPVLERVLKHGFSITEHCSPEDISNNTRSSLSRRIDVNISHPEKQGIIEQFKKTHGYED